MAYTCKYCGRPILWGRAPNGRFVPLDAEPNERGTRLLDENGFLGPADEPARVGGERWMPHWLSCTVQRAAIEEYTSRPKGAYHARSR